MDNHSTRILFKGLIGPFMIN